MALLDVCAICSFSHDMAALALAYLNNASNNYRDSSLCVLAKRATYVYECEERGEAFFPERSSLEIKLPKIGLPNNCRGELLREIGV